MELQIIYTLILKTVLLTNLLINILNVFFHNKLQCFILEHSYFPCTLVSPPLPPLGCSIVPYIQFDRIAMISSRKVIGTPNCTAIQAIFSMFPAKINCNGPVSSVVLSLHLVSPPVFTFILL